MNTVATIQAAAENIIDGYAVAYTDDMTVSLESAVTNHVITVYVEHESVIKAKLLNRRGVILAEISLNGSATIVDNLLGATVREFCDVINDERISF
jgi:hypothetical protein